MARSFGGFGRPVLPGGRTLVFEPHREDRSLEHSVARTTKPVTDAAQESRSTTPTATHSMPGNSTTEGETRTLTTTSSPTLTVT